MALRSEVCEYPTLAHLGTISCELAQYGWCVWKEPRHEQDRHGSQSALNSIPDAPVFVPREFIQIITISLSLLVLLCQDVPLVELEPARVVMIISV